MAALATLLEIADLLKNADRILPEAVAEYRTAHTDAVAALAELETARAAHDARQNELDKQSAVIAGREGDLATREAAAAALEQQTAEKQADFDSQAKTLEERGRILDARERAIEDDRKAAQQEISEQKAAAAAWIETANAVLEQSRRDAAAAIKAAGDKAHTEIAEKRSLADAESASIRIQAERRMAAAVEKEAQIRELAEAVAAMARE